MNHVNGDVETEVLKRLELFQQESGHKVLFACSQGSRAANYPAIDSDFDVRFVYKKELRDYVSVPVPGFAHRAKEESVTLNLESNLGTFDISGWDIRKLTWLIFKSNYHALEFLFSGQMYFYSHQLNYYREQVSQNFCRNYHGLHSTYTHTVDPSLSPLMNIHLLLRAAYVAHHADQGTEVFQNNSMTFDILSLSEWYYAMSGKNVHEIVEDAAHRRASGYALPNLSDTVSMLESHVCSDTVKSLVKGATVLPTSEQYKQLDHLTYQIIN